MRKDSLARKALVVKKSIIHGYGVFAGEDFAPDDVIEECHVILTYGGDHLLQDYYYSGGGKYHVIPTGYGMIYNHAVDPNATYIFDEEHELLIFKARRPIKEGEEILISYGDTWFEKREMEIKRISWPRKLYLYLIGMPLRALIVCGGLYLLVLLFDHLRASYLH